MRTSDALHVAAITATIGACALIAAGLGAHHGAALAAAESPEARVSRIAATLPFPVAWELDNDACSEGAAACYVPGTESTYLTDAALTRSDCYLRETLAHEWRHRWQHDHGFIRFTDDEMEILNRAQLEADATEFASNYDCDSN